MKKLLLAFFLVSRVLSENSPENGENLKRFPRELSCGRVAGGIELIFGGEKVQKGEYPWMAAMMKRNESGGPPAFFCGGVLISETKILTAAHCLHFKKARTQLRERDIIILLGMHDLEDTYEDGRVLTTPQEIFIHPKWNPFSQSFDADLAVLKPNRKILFDDHISPICLWDSPEDLSPSKGTVVGYGKSENRNKFHETKPKKLEVPVIDLLECILKDPLFAKIASENMICGGAGDGQGACTGDSGGGLFFKHNNKFYLLGIVSASLNDQGGCDVTKPALFTNIFKYKNWIENPSNEYQNSGQYLVYRDATQKPTRSSTLPSILTNTHQLEPTNRNDLIVCKNGWQSISWSLMCDGNEDCNDGSDETRCVKGVIDGLIFRPFGNTTIDDEYFGIASSVNESVERFYIYDNKNVKFLPNNLSKKFPKLIEVDVQICSVSKITAKNFEGLGDLKKINLLYNQIGEIEKGSFDDLKSLEELHLGFNKLRNLDENLFANLINLRKLSLEQNQLTTLSENLFANLINLQTLDLHRNQLTTLLGNLFRNLEKLEFLNLSENKISLPWNIFSNVKQLKQINLHGNKLKILPEKLFENNQKLEWIALDKNEIEKIPSDLFDHLSEVESIDLRDNKCIDVGYGNSWSSTHPLNSTVKTHLKNKLQEYC